METVVALVIMAGLAAAAVWWSMSRPPGSAPSGAGLEGPAGGEGKRGLFVLPPSAVPEVSDDRPPPGISLAKLALAVAVVTVVLVAVVSGITLLLKLQLDGYFRPGG